MAIDCDFAGVDFQNENTDLYDDCLNSCVFSPICTHFVWLNNTCHKKQGHVTKNMSIPKLGALCGIVAPLGILYF